MSKKVIKIISTSIVLSSLFLVGCNSTKTVDVNILATSDLHGVVPYEMVDFIKEEKGKDSNTLVVDAGDFYDTAFGTSGDMMKYFEEKRDMYESGKNKHIEFPLAKEMKDAGFNTVTLGNHEFVANNKQTLDNMISDFEKQGIDVLSANTYKQNGESYVKPYIIKELETEEGPVKVGILGLTLKEVGESQNYVDGKLVPSKSMELKDQPQFEGKLYMNDMVEDAQKWVDIMNEKENPDIIVAVAHSGERPKKPKHPGNRIQDLAQNVSGIDVIVAGHNHVQIKQHDYENKDGETVIVTEPGKHGECMSKINIKVEKNKDGWEVLDKSSDIVQFEESKKSFETLSDNFGKVLMGFGMLIDEGKEGEIISLDKQIPIKWDTMHIFKPNTPREEIYEKAGYKFLNIAEVDNSNQVILMNEGKVIFYSNILLGGVPLVFNVDDTLFDKNTLTIKYGENDDFKIVKGDKFHNSNTNIVELNYEG